MTGFDENYLIPMKGSFGPLNYLYDFCKKASIQLKLKFAISSKFYPSKRDVEPTVDFKWDQATD